MHTREKLKKKDKRVAYNQIQSDAQDIIGGKNTECFVMLVDGGGEKGWGGGGIS